MKTIRKEIESIESTSKNKIIVNYIVSRIIDREVQDFRKLKKKERKLLKRKMLDKDFRILCANLVEEYKENVQKQMRLFQEEAI